MWNRLFLSVTAWLFLGLTQTSEAAIDLPVADFALEATGEFEGWVDGRDLLVLSHPWKPSATGGFVEASLSTTIPADAQPPLRLGLSISDDFFNDFWRAKKESWLGGDGFYGHRFKQVWANGILLYEEDVADANPPQAPSSRAFELPEGLKPGDTLDLSLKVIDKVSSWIALASDTQHLCTLSGGSATPTEPAKYMTHVYWGDIRLLSEGEPLPSTPLPLEDLVETVHEERWPLAPYGDPDLDPPLVFRLDTVAPLPRPGFPVKCGLSLPYGKVRESEDIALVDAEGLSVRAKIEATSTWPDGSIRWVRVEFIARPGDEDKTFRVVAASKERSARPLIAGATAASRIAQRPNISSSLPPPSLQGPQWSAISPFCGRVSYALRFNRDPHNNAVPLDPFSEARVLFGVRVGDEAEIFWEGGKSPIPNSLAAHPVAPAFQLVLTDEMKTLVNGEPSEATATNWVAIRSSEAVDVAVLRNADFTGQAGFEIARIEDTVMIDALPFTEVGSTIGYPFTAGEAKTFHVFCQSLPADAEKSECANLAKNVNHPPLLVNSDLLARSGALGYAAYPASGSGEELIAWLKKTYPDPLGSSLAWGKTPRDFGDTIYNASNSWRNGYYDLRQGFTAAYLLSENREWADALDRAVGHYVDVDIIHSDKEHPNRVGLPHGYGENHTSMDTWSAIARMNGILWAAHIWGNAEYYEAAMLMARRIAENGLALGAGSVRDHAGVMMSMASAYRETRDPLFKEAADKLIADVLENRIDTRRGCYPEVHGNWNYRGNVPWMTAQLIEPAYLYYRESGSLDAAKLVVGLASSILDENQERGVPGDIYGYSHNPHFAKTSGYHVLIAPSLYYAYELTGEARFAEAAKAAWEQTLKEGTINDVQNCFWNTPTLVYYLRSSER